MPEYYTPEQKIYDDLFILKEENRIVDRSVQAGKPDVWKIGLTEYSPKFNPIFERMVILRELAEVGQNQFMLTESGKEQMVQYDKVGN